MKNAELAIEAAKIKSKLEPKDKVTKVTSLKDENLWWKQINSKASKLSSGDQVVLVPVIVKMSDYTKKKMDRVDWYSNPFYTHHEGYQMCLNVVADGWGSATQSTHLSVYLYLMKGPYDTKLNWPLVGDCTVKLLNQISNSGHHLKTSGAHFADGRVRVTSREKSSTNFWGRGMFISNKDLQKVTITRQYLKDDSIFLQVDCKIAK